MSYLATYIGLMGLRFSRVRGLYPLVLLALFVFSAFRFEVGCDWTGYLAQFELFGRVPLSEIWLHREPLWTAIISIQTSLGLPYPWLNVISSAIFFFGTHALARRQPNPLAFLVLLFPVLIVNMPMSGIRQGAAIGIVSLAFLAFMDRRPVPFVLMVLTATGIHSSAVVFLLLAPLVGGRLTRTRLILAALLAIPGAALLMTSDSAELATERYVNTGVDAAGAAFRLLLLLMTAAYFFLFLNRKWAVLSPQDHKLAFIGALAMVLTAALLPVSSVIGDRLGYYLLPIQAMIFARAPFLRTSLNRNFVILAPYLGFLLFFGVWTALSHHFSACYLPYQTWLFGFPAFSRYY